MTKREREILKASVSWTDKTLTVNEEKAFQAGAQWADKTRLRRLVNGCLMWTMIVCIIETLGRNLMKNYSSMISVKQWRNSMKICITTSEMSQLQYQFGEGKIKTRSFIVNIPNENLPQGLQDFLKLREEDSDFMRYSNVDSITVVEE